MTSTVHVWACVHVGLWELKIDEKSDEKSDEKNSKHFLECKNSKQELN